MVVIECLKELNKKALYNKMYKNNYYTEKAYKEKRNATIEQLKEKTFEESGEEFIFENIDLLEQEILTKEELDSIKKLVDTKNALKSKDDIELINKYIEDTEELIKYELIRRDIDINNLQIEKQLKSTDGYKLMRKYLDTNSELIMDELTKRGLYSEELLRRVKVLKNLRDSDLMLDYFKPEDEMVAKELMYRKLPLSKEKIVKKLDNINLIELYNETQNGLIEEELKERELTEFI
ncbi:hypothetical protein [Caldisalinibacter kiritimatiensis]|uniref:Uncharacterized protein n=1 Tax=Caldisalinibacter kiritimatiensis TaxID=1304284 RepID=R1CBH3_9FIRM|nr:hypothetical protein [Caldisalinibacter kiritimatiensis]EOC99669.1 hypothetical protein L21TH_2312 [Caldisalinibacter kiritimatiensis]